MRRQNKPLNHRVRLPRLSKVLDHAYVYAVFALVGLAMIGTVLYNGYSSLQRVFAEPVENSPYEDVLATESAALSWAKSMAEYVPSGYENWEVGSGHRPQALVPADKCTLEDVSANQLATYTSGNGELKVRVSVYSAGMARADFDARAEGLSQCGGTQDGAQIVFKDGFVFTMGDAVVSVFGGDVRKLLDEYWSVAKETLVSTGCVSLEVSTADAGRNLFANSNDYTGLVEKKDVSSSLSIKRMPVVSLESIKELDGRDVNRPENPLPESFPGELPDEVPKPSLPDAPDMIDSERFTTQANYKIADIHGPGCGWAWSAYKKPIYDDNELNKARREAILVAQETSNKEAKAYIAKHRDYALSLAMVAPHVRAWNTYTDKVASIKEKWAWLNDEREKIKPAYLEYVAAHDDWLTFDDRKKQALEEYTKALKTCRDKQKELIEWEKEYGDKNNPPPRPEGCEMLPPRPAIIDQDKPEEPKMPEIPASITIPESWQKPMTKQ